MALTTVEAVGKRGDRDGRWDWRFRAEPIEGGPVHPFEVLDVGETFTVSAFPIDEPGSFSDPSI